MKIHDCIQGTTAWLELRAGIPTASDFDRILTPSGKPSTQAEKYLYRLLAERLMGHPITEAVSMWMERGSLQEKNAVSFYELQRDCDTVPCGFVTTDDGSVGASPDRLVGNGGLLEIKCPSEPIHMGYLLKSGSAYEAYKVQCQGQLWVTDREWVDVLSYHPELPYALVTIQRDQEFIDKLAAAVGAFSQVLEKTYIDLIAQGLSKTA